MSTAPNAQVNPAPQPAANEPMTPFVSQLRTRGAPILLAPDGTAGAITIRVEMPEVWDVRAIVVAPTEPVVAVKQRALAELFPRAASHEDFIVKLRGWEILDEHATLADAGVQNGSILLLTHRKRRPVR
jgi:hypothetical protein